MEKEKKLIDGLRRGEEKAYRTLYHLHYKPLCSAANRMLNDPFLAESIVNDTIFHLWEKRESLTITFSLRRYLLQAVKNRCLNLLEQHRRFTPLDGSEEQLTHRKLLDERFDETSPMYQLIEEELDLKIRDALESLPPLTRSIFFLSRRQALSYKEIAEKETVSVDVVKYHLKSALRRLRIALKQYLND